MIKNIGHHYTSPVAEKPKPIEQKPEKAEEPTEVLRGVTIVGKIDLDNLHAKPQPVERNPL